MLYSHNHDGAMWKKIKWVLQVYMIMITNITSGQEEKLHVPVLEFSPKSHRKKSAKNKSHRSMMTNNYWSYISSTLLSTCVKEQHLEEAHGPSETHSSRDYCKAVSLE